MFDASLEVATDSIIDHFDDYLLDELPDEEYSSRKD
jgi:hypothetical protein